MIVDKLIEKIIETQNPTCVGLDTSPDYLPEELLSGVKDLRTAAQAVLTFNKNIIDRVCDVVPAVKVQIAYYEQLGYHGIKAFGETCRYAKGKGLIVIADAKRNDIGPTASCYANAYLGKTQIAGKEKKALPCDFLTVNWYLGSDCAKPFVEQCRTRDKGVFALVKTSNPSSGELQDLKLEDGRTVYEVMADMVASFRGRKGKYGYSRVGAVVGATYPEQAAALRKRLQGVFFLIPGYGAQGGNAEMLRGCFDRNGLGGIVNNSRGILLAYRKRGGSYDTAAREAVLEMKADLLSVLGEIHA